MEYTLSFNVFYLKSSGVSQHNNLLGLNEGDFIHLTAAEKAKFDSLPNSFATKTSDLTNDGEDGVNPFITAQDIPEQTIPTLDQVTTEGNTTTNGIIVGGVETEYVRLLSFPVEVDLKAEGITESRELFAPDENGTIATREWVTANAGGGEWGSITGTLSDQTDLQTALNDKLDKVTTSGVERAYIINADGSQGTKATSDFGDNYDLGNWLVNRFTHNNAVQPYLLGSTIAGGIFSTVGITSIDSFKTMSGFVISSSTSANSGYQFITTSANIKPINNLAIYGVFKIIQTTRDNVIRFGYGVFGTNQIRLEILTNQVTLVCSNSGVTSTSASETLVADVFYIFLIEKISNTSVKAKIKRVSDGVVVFDKEVTTNIPTSSNTNIGTTATITTAGTGQGIVQVSELSFGIKPNFLNGF
jgi:hypothetical protein